MKSVLVVGAGPAGLAVSLKLAQAGIRTLVVERAPIVGGNCRSFNYGAYTFDVGVHFFGRCEGAVRDFVRQYCGSGLIPIGHLRAASYFRGGYRPELGAL